MPLHILLPRKGLLTSLRIGGGLLILILALPVHAASPRAKGRGTSQGVQTATNINADQASSTSFTAAWPIRS